MPELEDAQDAKHVDEVMVRGMEREQDDQEEYHVPPSFIGSNEPGLEASGISHQDMLQGMAKYTV